VSKHLTKQKMPKPAWIKAASKESKQSRLFRKSGNAVFLHGVGSVALRP
jgi:hypothetical protein